MPSVLDKNLLQIGARGEIELNRATQAIAKGPMAEEEIQFYEAAAA